MFKNKNILGDGTVLELARKDFKTTVITLLHKPQLVIKNEIPHTEKNGFHKKQINNCVEAKVVTQVIKC